jgi:hypothetical protein
MNRTQTDPKGTSTHTTPGARGELSSVVTNPIDRRSFLARTGAGAAVMATAGAVSLPAFETEAIALSSGAERARQAANIKRDAATAEQRVPIPAHPNNGDEALYPNKIGNYSKCLKHDPLTGEVVPSAYNALVAAINSGSSSAFEALVTNGHFGNPNQATRRRLVNPQSAYAFDLEGTDSHQLAIRPAPAFASAEEAGEMVELYWMALLRDIPFADWDTDPTVQAACDDISNLSDFRGPKQGGQVTPQTLFRDTYFGCTDGPYISQFLLQPAGFGAQRVDQRIQSNAPGIDFMTTFQDWLDTQNGIQTTAAITPGNLVFCNDGRALSQYVHVDVLFQAYFVAFLILAGGGYPLDANNPYGPTLDPGSGRPLPTGVAGTKSQTGFGTFGAPGIATFVTEPSSRALKAQWFQKWLVHRRLRPEEFGGRVEVQRLGRATYPFHPDLANSTVLAEVLSRFGTYLLPIAFPEGSPNHTSYGSGHATVAGACITMLKAFFDESAEIVNPVMPSADGTTLVPYAGPPLTVGGELNKIASNVSQGRNIAGVHWRTDATESNKLGEAVAISILRDTRTTGFYNEPFTGFTMTKFDGTQITI